jgi:hypothetical protein
MRRSDIVLSALRFDSRLVLEQREEPSQGRQRLAQLVGAHLGGDLVGPGVLRERDLADSPVPGVRAGQQFGAAVRRVEAIFGEAVFYQQVCDPLDSLAGQPHMSRDFGDGAWLVKRATEHLPPGGRESAVGGERLGDLQELSI